MVTYLTDTSEINATQLLGFFEGWPNPPNPERHLAILRGSAHVVLAMTNEAVIGFITAISDGILSAYIPLLEVRPSWRRQGIGTELVRRMLDQLSDFYMIDLTCDPNLQTFYNRAGFIPVTGAMVRNYERQAGRETVTSTM